jgi:hypothetical protein
MTATLNSPLPFKGGDQGVDEHRWGLNAPGGAFLSSARKSFERADARTHPNPSLEREGR